MIKKLSNIQKKLFKHNWGLLKRGGSLVYSTCTLEPDENEGLINYALEEFDDVKVEPIKLDIKKSTPIEEFEGKKYSSEVKKTLRIWPQDNNTEGFYVAKLSKL